MIYELDTTPEIYKKQLRAFINDTGWTGIFKKNISDSNKIVGEESLGITKKGQLVKIRAEGVRLRIET